MRTGPTGFMLMLLISAALPVQAESGWTDYAAVTQLTPSIHRRFVAKIAVDKNPSGCKAKQGFYQDYDLPGADSMFRTLLEALSHNKRVRVYVTGGCDIDGNAEISAISIAG